MVSSFNLKKTRSHGRFQRLRWVVVCVTALWLSLGAGLRSRAGNIVPLTPAETDWLKKHPVIRIAPTPDYQPVEFLDTNGSYGGITAEYFQLIQARVGCKFTVVRPTPAQWLELDPEKRGADVITASAKTPNRAPFWIFTKVYLALPTYVITRENADDDLTPGRLAGQTVAVVHGWAAEEYLRAHYPKLNLQPVPDAASGLRKVSFGLADAFVSELPVATAWMEKEGIANLKISAPAGYTYRLGISVRKDWPELRDILDRALDTISPAERQQIMDHWLTLKTPEARQRDALWRKITWSLAGLFLLLLGALVWNRLLAWQIRMRTRELRESEDKFSKAFRSSPLALAVTTWADGRFLDVNEAFLKINGFSREQVIGHTSTELGMWTHPEDRVGLAEKLRAERRILNLKRPFGRSDGTVGTGLYSIELIELGGHPCGLLLINDITEQERVEAALRENELRLRLMADLIAGYSYSYLAQPDRSTKLEWLSQAGEKVLGFTEIELKSTVRFRERIHHDDLPGLRSAIDSVLAGIPEVIEFRFRTKSGQLRWLQCFNRPEWSDREKRVVRILGAGQDVTDRRTSEQALRDSIENTPHVCVQWLDEAGQVIFWNHASQLTYGWSAAEALHKKLGQLMHTPEQEGWFQQKIQAVKATGTTFGPQEIPFQRRDGQAGVCLSTLFLISAPNGGQIYVRTDIDLSDLKRAEADRTQLLAELHVAEDAERRRIARELHDSTAQQLAVLKMNLSLLLKKSPDLGASLHDSLALIDEAIQEIRNFTWLLHPPLLDELGLSRALTDYAAGFAKRTGITTAVETAGFSGRLPAARELALFRVAQESLTNIMRHSGSQTALIRLERDDEQVRLEIQDAGRGIASAAKTGVGMAGMRERLRLVGGSLDIESDPEGTTVLATIPLHSVGHDTEFLFRTSTQSNV